MVLHGMGEHKERYILFMEWLALQGYASVCYDQRGHGASVKSPNDVGYVHGGWRAAVGDARVVAEYVASRYGAIPFVVFGHGAGSLLARSFVKRYPEGVDMLFVCGCPSDQPKKYLGWAAATAVSLLCGARFRPRFFQKMIFWNFNGKFAGEGYPAAWICSDKSALNDYHNDRFCQTCYTANGFKAIFGLMIDCYSSRGWKVPGHSMQVHFLSGADDPCLVSDEALSKSASKIVRAGYLNVDVTLYPGMRHEILNETLRLDVWKDILQKLP